MPYTALVLHPEDQRKLLDRFIHLLPADWEHFGHHMTINMGEIEQGPARHLEGQEAEVEIVSLGKNELVVAVGVKSAIPSTNTVKHITLAVNRDGGGKPKHSNFLEEWEPILEPFILRGIIKVC